MYAIEARRQAEVGAVVHDQAYLAAERPPQFSRVAQHLPATARLIPVLDERRSAFDQLASKRRYPNRLVPSAGQ
jgi:hypothetical protein